jgi:hypothetical protein
MPTFQFETYVTRGREEREIMVSAEYTYDGEGLPELEWACEDDGGDLSRYETESVKDDMADRCQADYAEWLSDQDVCHDNRIAPKGH